MTRRLYCHCAFAKVVPEATKDAVLSRLTESEAGFDAVPDLCEMSARKDPALARLAGDGEPVKIAACYPRAVKWLFHAAGVTIDEQAVEVLNMRTDDPDAVANRLLEDAS